MHLLIFICKKDKTCTNKKRLNQNVFLVMMLQKSSLEISLPLVAALWSISSSSVAFMVSPSSLATLLILLTFTNPVLSSSKRSKILLIPFQINQRFTLVYLSPNLEVIPSKNSSKSISLPSASRSEIMLKMVGFLVSNPRLCMADLSYLGSILPVASVSKRLNASLSYSISSSVKPGLQIFFFWPGLVGTVLPFIDLRFKLYYCSADLYEIQSKSIFD